MSIRLRLMIIFTSLMGVILAAFSVYVYYSTVSIRTNAFFDRLWERAEISFQLLQQSSAPDLSMIHPSVRNTYWTILPDEEIVVFDQAGNYTYINEYVSERIDYQPILAMMRDSARVELKIGDRQVVGLIRKIDGASYYVIVSAFDKNGQRLLVNLKITLISSFLASILVIILAGWYFSRESFKPVERIIETAEKISESDLHLRVPIPKGRTELVRLVNTINDSLDRLQRSFEVQKTFVANASHELRTPLTALRGELEIALLRDRTTEEYKHFVAVAYEDAKRLSQLVNHLLLFAQTSADRRGFPFVPVRIDELVMDVVQKLMLNYPLRHIEIRFTGNAHEESDLIMPGNENLLSVAFNNIIDNALKYSVDSPVYVEIKPDEPTVISIIDSGLGISLNDIEHIFVPFYRSKRSSDIVGFGLGLPLANQIIELHGGLVVIDSKINEGTIVQVMFPKPNA
jgi:signal transduction histidine kinase